MAGYDCHFVTDPPDQLNCLICTFVARDPYQVDCCGRVYCKDCLDELKVRSNKCPNCRKHGNSFRDHRADRDIQALQVTCDNEENGCMWSGELRRLDSHVADCRFTLICCPNDCLDDDLNDVFVLRKGLDRHLRECPNREFECPHCKERGKYHKITGDHLDDCPQLEVPCTKRCKTEVIRSQMQEHFSRTCPNVAVACKYSNLGCEETLLRKDMGDHENDSALHLQFALDTVVMLKEANCVQVLPTVFKMTDFESLKESSMPWYSPPFYTHCDGYKMQLKVYANGTSDGKDTHVSATTNLMRGRNDGKLVWPFRGEVTIQLLNQLEDQYHHSSILKYYEEDVNRNNSVVGGEMSTGWRLSSFFRHSKLGQSVVNNCQYLKDDTLYFRLSVKVYDSNKPWLACAN